MTPRTASDLIETLEASRRHFEAAPQGLSDSGALKKPAPHRWSVIDCIEHLCVTEGLGLKRLQAAETAPDGQPNPDREVAMAAQVANRSNPIQGPPVAMPTGRFTTLSEALAEFSATRTRIIEFVKSCPNPAMLRVTHPFFGPLSGREYVILIAGHSTRHAAQIEEIRTQLGS